MTKDKSSAKIVVGILIMASIILMVSIVPFFLAIDPYAANQGERLEGISAKHLLGTDRYGRDLFIRTLYGGRVTLIAALSALSMALIVGILIGIVTGLNNQSLLDTIVMRLIDVLMAFPFMVFAMVIAAFWGASLHNLLIAVVTIWWVPFARLARSITLQSKNDLSIASATVLGASKSHIIFKELLPKVISHIFVLATFELGILILSISALSFLGMGAQPPTAEWGSMLSDARAHVFLKPHLILGPAMFITLTVLSLNLIGEGMRDLLDPYETLTL